MMSPKSLREQVRHHKNQAIQNYFHQRIYRHESPYQIWGRSQPLRVLLILGHMRSGSSLLTHILNHNPAILGYGETHITYESAEDFKQLMARVYWRCNDFKRLSDLQNLRMTHQYVLDKVLHNKLLVDESLLTHPQVSMIFLVREPTGSLASLQKLKPYLTEQERFGYYKNRLIKLGDYAELVDNKEKTLWVTYEQLLNQTQPVLNRFQEFLGTKTEFSEQYKLLKTTGKRWVGDSNEKIKTGKIIRHPTTSDHALSNDIEAEANAIYQNTCQRLQTFCSPSFLSS
ncbi:MAG: sulfotransferase domain-containing protein [Phormidium sp. BM_Day4_Bin.17]|nr:sulfotransferase domain-containing protein [Phormidium sp. BM_Day4_Bin.17]UCJ10763.1 MAG: sulfotransferase domain-containing protein [Phormidium sp. PBR-2020]